MDYMIPTSAVGQLALLLWSLPLIIWGVIFMPLWAGLQEGKTPIWIQLGWAVAGAFIIGNWGITVQLRATELCR
jgi:hypothetical protein